MLTTFQENIPLNVTPMEEDVLCAVRHAEPRPQTVCHSSVLHSCDEISGSSPRRRSNRLLRNKDLPEERARSENSAGAHARRLDTSLIQKEKANRKISEKTEDIQWPGDKTLRTCKRKLELTMPSHMSMDSTTVEKHSHSSVDFEPECTGSPPPAKRWVIGPLLQSLKSKMASFTEIVMSPVRLFKPNDSSLSDAVPSRCEQLTEFNKECSSRSKEEQVDVGKDGKDDVFCKEETICSPQRKSTVVQRLRFNTNSNNVSDSISQSENESSGLLCLPQSISENHSSNPRDLSRQFEEPLGSLSIQEQISQDKPAYEKEVHNATSISKQTDMSNLAQEKSGFTTPRLISELTEMAHTLDIRSPIHEAPHQNTSSFSLSLTEDEQRKGLLDSKEPSLRIPIRTSPRKTSKHSENKEILSVKPVIKSSATLSEALDFVKPGLRSTSNSKAHVQPLYKDKDVLTPGCETEKKRKATPNTFSDRGLAKEESVKKVMNSSKRTRKECKFDHMDKSPTVTLFKIAGNGMSVGIRKKVQVTGNAALSVCNASVVVERESSGNGSSVEKQKIGQDRASRSKSRRDAQCRTPAVLGSKNNTSDHSSSSDAMKSALMDNGLQGNKANMTDMSDCGVYTPVEAHQSIKSMNPQKMDKDEPSVMSTRSRKTRQCEVMCKIRKSEDMDIGVETHSLAGNTEETLAKDGHHNCEEMIHVSDHEHSKITLRNNVRQAKHKLETSGAASEISSNWPAIKKPTVSANKSETRATKRATDALEEQRVSMSLTLQVETDAPVHSGSTAPWQNARPVNCRTTRRLGKEGSPAMERSGTSSTSKSKAMYLNDQDLIDQDDGHLSKREVARKRKLKVDRERRRCTSLAKKRDVQDDGVQTRNLKEEAVPVVSSSGSGSSRLLRSFSCPDIPSFLHSDYASLPPLHDPVPPSPPKKSCPVPPHTPHPHSPSKRARRHTVCSVEIEREIAPLCLRKEVCPYSHSSSLTILTSTFLSSPLAFLSKKSSQGCSDDDLGFARTSPRRFKSSSPSFLKSPTSPTLTANPAFSASVPHTPEHSSASVSSPCSVFEPVPMEADVVQQECEEDEQSNFSLELSSRVDSEEKALSDSEIKTDDKQIERRKVSSIRIRKTLPKPQYNLTPMGLPKAIRIKKKVFSVEEIYTNKNFSKPPEGRLETIYEVPLSRRDGSESLVGLKRMKRFVEFPELGVARKPRKPLVGAAGVGGAQRKAAGNPGAGRTRRGVGACSREEEALTPQDLDSLLCLKLNELDSWMVREQVAY